MHGLYQRGNVWWFRFSPPGRGQVRLSTGESDEALAIGFARNILERPELVDFGPDAFSVEVAAFIAHKRKAGRSEATLRKYQTVATAFLKQHDTDNPRSITPAIARAWFEARLKLNPRTATDYMSWLNLFFNWLVESHKLRKNPFEDIEPPTLKPAIRRRFLTPPEARRLIRTCREPGLKFALYCALHAGLRKEEVIQARPSWFDLRAGLLHVTGDAHWHPKDRDNRTIPLTTEFKAWLKGRKWPGPFMLAPDATKGRYRYRYEFRKPFMRHVAACKLQNVTFHDLRRTFASLAVSSGVSLFKVSRWLGDGHRVVERSYAHLMPNDEQINAAWEDSTDALR